MFCSSERGMVGGVALFDVFFYFDDYDFISHNIVHKGAGGKDNLAVFYSQILIAVHHQ